MHYTLQSVARAGLPANTAVMWKASVQKHHWLRVTQTSWHLQEMNEDVEGSGRVGEGVGVEGYDVKEFQFGWNEDKVDLEFKTGQSQIKDNL